MRGALAVLALVATSSLAGANGRPPITNGVFMHPGEAETLFVRSTFGLLVSKDDGCSFRWICEQAIGYGGTVGAPLRDDRRRRGVDPARAHGCRRRTDAIGRDRGDRSQRRASSI